MRVVFGLTSGIVSGVDVFGVGLVRALRRRGLDARIALSRPAVPRAAAPLPIPPDVPVDVLPPWPVSWRGRWAMLAAELARDGGCVYLPNYDYDHSAVCPALPDSVAVVGIVHSDDPRHYEHARRLGASWDAVVAVSPAILERVRREMPALAPRLSFIPYGIRVPPAVPARPAAPRLEIAYVGRLAREQKRVLDLPVILRGVLASGVDARLTVAGDGPDRRAAQRACRGLPEGAVRFTGTLDGDGVARLLAGSHALLLPSDYEGLPLALLEAMAAGCVPVVSDLPSGIPLLVEDGVSGFRVPPGDTAAFAQRLAALGRDGAWRARLSEAARARASAYDIDDVARRYHALFDTIRARPSGRPPRGGVPLPPPVFEQSRLQRWAAPLRVALGDARRASAGRPLEKRDDAHDGA